jgi:hypothetical protein
MTAVLLVGLGLVAILGRPASVTAAIQRHQEMRQEVPAPEDAAEFCCDAEEPSPGPEG